MCADASWGELWVCGGEGKVKGVFWGVVESVFFDIYVHNGEKGVTEDYVHWTGDNYWFMCEVVRVD